MSAIGYTRFDKGLLQEMLKVVDRAKKRGVLDKNYKQLKTRLGRKRMESTELRERSSTRPAGSSAE